MSSTITKSEAAMHLETAPRTFEPREIGNRTSSRTLKRMCEEAESLTKADALRLAQTLMVHVYSAGIGYGDITAPKAVTTHVGQAIRALRGLSL